MNIIQAALLGLVQGITEFFPISSSGHLTLVGDFLGAEGSSNLMFMIMLHLGTLFSVLTVFHKDVHRILAEYCGMAGDILFNLKLHFRDPLHRSGVRYRRIVNGSYRKFAAMLLVSMIPTVIVAYLVSPIVEMLTGNLLASGLGLFVTALLLFVSSFMLSNNRGPRESKYLDAFVIGAFQGFAAFPGNSRLAMTLSSGFLSGFTRKFALKYAFVLSVPTIIGAMILEATRSHAMDVRVGILPCLVGMLVSAFVGFFVIRIAMKLLSRKRSRFFAAYCLIIGILSIARYLV